MNSDLHLRRDRPPDPSRILVERKPDSVTITVRPPPLLSTSSGQTWFLLAVAIVLTVAAAFFTVCLVNFVRAGFPSEQLPWALLILPIFPGTAAVWLWAVDCLTRKAVIDVGQDALWIRHTGVIPRRQFKCTRAEMGSVLVVPSNTSYGPLLRVRPRRGKSFDMLAGRDEVELKWLARLISEELRLDALPPASPETETIPAEALKCAGWVDVINAIAGLIAWPGMALVLWGAWACIPGYQASDARVLPFWVIGGLFLGVAHGVVWRARQQKHGRALADFAARLGFTFEAHVDRTTLGNLQDMPVLRDWADGNNLMAGPFDGVSLWMLDYTDCRPSALANGDEWTFQTVVFVPAPAHVPTFDLGPGWSVPLPFNTSEGKAFFTERPGWYIQSDGKFLAFWRRNEIVRAFDRLAFLEEILAANQVFAGGKPQSSAPAIPFDKVARARKSRIRWLTFFGFILGFIATTTLIAVDSAIQGQRAFFHAPSVTFALWLLGPGIGLLAGRLASDWPGTSGFEKKRDYEK
jgi:hypothetical protein